MRGTEVRLPKGTQLARKRQNPVHTRIGGLSDLRLLHLTVKSLTILKSMASSLEEYCFHLEVCLFKYDRYSLKTDKP